MAQRDRCDVSYVYATPQQEIARKAENATSSSVWMRLNYNCANKQAIVQHHKRLRYWQTRRRGERRKNRQDRIGRAAGGGSGPQGEGKKLQFHLRSSCPNDSMARLCLFFFRRFFIILSRIDVTASVSELLVGKWRLFQGRGWAGAPAGDGEKSGFE